MFKIDPAQKSKNHCLEVFLCFLCCRGNRFCLSGEEGYLTRCWNRDGGRGRYASVPHPSRSLRVTEQVRNINSGSSCGPLLHTCGPGYELAPARPLSTLVTNVNTLLSETHKQCWEKGGKDTLRLIIRCFLLIYCVYSVPSLYARLKLLIQAALCGPLYSTDEQNNSPSRIWVPHETTSSGGDRPNQKTNWEAVEKTYENPFVATRGCNVRWHERVSRRARNMVHV